MPEFLSFTNIYSHTATLLRQPQMRLCLCLYYEHVLSLAHTHNEPVVIIK